MTTPPIPYQARLDALHGDSTPLVGAVTVAVPAGAAVDAVEAALAVRAASPQGRPIGPELLGRPVPVAPSSDGSSYEVAPTALGPADWPALPSRGVLLAEVEVRERAADGTTAAVRTLARVAVTVHPDVARRADSGA